MLIGIVVWVVFLMGFDCCFALFAGLTVGVVGGYGGFFAVCGCIWLFGYLVIWLFGYLVIWLSGRFYG